MIEFANNKTMPLVRQMWKACFGDTKEYMDLYFSRVYKHQNTLIYFENGVAVASLQMHPYNIRFYNENVPFYYLVGLCTLPEYRNMGYMRHLIEASHCVMQERGIPLSILVPAEDWLFGYYTKFGYEQVFEKSDTPIPSLKSLLKRFKGIDSAYEIFKKEYQQHNLCVQKSLFDFETVIMEYELDGCPDKYNLAAMARVIDAEYLIERYPFAKDQNGDLRRLDIHLQCRLLFGYKTSELGSPYCDLYPEQHPIINLMLE